MSGGLIGCALTPHTPRMANEDGARDFIRPLIAGSRALGDWIRHLEPDGVVLHTTHWISTFNWYTSSHAIHEGHCIADEAPELVPGLPYKYTGDPTLAQEIIDVALAKNIPFKSNDNPHYRWDYGTYVPMKYIDPEATLPIVTLPTVILAKLDECIRVGQALDVAAKKQNKRIVFIGRSEEHTSELQSRSDIVCRLLLEKNNNSRHLSPPHIAIPNNETTHNKFIERR